MSNSRRNANFSNDLSLTLANEKRSRTRLTCSTLPPGRARWTLKLLTTELVALEVVDAIAPETVRPGPPKTR